MIASGDYSGWTQVGYIRWYDHVTVQFAQHHYAAQGDEYPTKYGTMQLVDGTVYGYGERWDPSTGYELDRINGSDFWKTAFDPFAKWSTPFVAQFDGEARYLQSDVPGNSASPTHYTDIQGQRFSDNTFVSMPCGYLVKGNDGSSKRTDGESWHDVLAGSCPDFEIYTDTAG